MRASIFPGETDLLSLRLSIVVSHEHRHLAEESCEIMSNCDFADRSRLKGPTIKVKLLKKFTYIFLTIIYEDLDLNILKVTYVIFSICNNHIHLRLTDCR